MTDDLQAIAGFTPASLISDIKTAITNIENDIAPLAGYAQQFEAMLVEVSASASAAAQAVAQFAESLATGVAKEAEWVGKKLDSQRFESILASTGGEILSFLSGLTPYLSLSTSAISRLIPASASPTSATYGADLKAALGALSNAYTHLCDNVMQIPQVPLLAKALDAAGIVLDAAPGIVLAALERILPLDAVQTLVTHIGAAAGGTPHPSTAAALGGPGGGKIQPSTYLKLASWLAEALKVTCSLLAKVLSFALGATLGAKASLGLGVNVGWAAALFAALGVAVDGEGGLRVSVTVVDLTGAVFGTLGALFGLIKIGTSAASKILADRE